MYSNKIREPWFSKFIINSLGFKTLNHMIKKEEISLINMVRRRVGIKKIEDMEERQLTFCKRPKRLFEKANEFGRICDAELAVIIIISETASACAFGNPAVDSVVERYKKAKKAESPFRKRNDDDPKNDHLNEDDDDDDQEKSEMGLAKFPKGSGSSNNQEDQYKNAVVEFEVHSAAHSKMMPLLSGDVPNVEDLDLHELEELMAQMEEMKKKVVDRANQIKNSFYQHSSSVPGGSGSH